MKSYTKRIGVCLIIAGILLTALVAYRNSHRRYIPTVFAPETMLMGLWNNYKKEYMEEGTSRVLDRQQDNITTSEGQSYALLRAVWEDDRETFTHSWQWTKDNMQHKTDPLFSWLFGKRQDGSYGVMTEKGGENTATDADTDIAVALLFASRRWQDSEHAESAKKIINEIWNQEIITIRGRPYLAANNIERYATAAIVVNPSYCTPYAYRMFKEVDPDHDWIGVLDTCYELIEKSAALPLDKESANGLVPDWVLIDRRTGELLPPHAPQTTNFGFDAFRLPFRLALDYSWYNEPRAKDALERMQILSTEWNQTHALATVHDHAGHPVQKNETPAMYGSTLGYFVTIDPSLAKEILEQKLQSLYNPDTFNWKEPLTYYDSNWAWFGMALYYRLLPNLFTL